MAYVVVVFAIINTAALLAMGVLLFYITRDMPGWVETAVADEIRKQDDRIEKRQAKVSRTPEEDDGMISGALDGVLPGRPIRRR